jgi:hypothetical protein
MPHSTEKQFFARTPRAEMRVDVSNSGALEAKVRTPAAQAAASFTKTENSAKS